VTQLSLAGRRPAVLIAVAVLIVVVLVVALSGLHRGGSSSSPDSSLQRTGERVAAVLNHPKRVLPVPDQSFRSFQAWYYDLRSTAPAAARALAAGQLLEAQVYDRDAFPPQVLAIPAQGRAFIIVDANTVNSVIQNGKPALTTLNVNGRPYRAYVAHLTVPANLQPANVGGYFVVLQPG
jgi:hypothetical protein